MALVYASLSLLLGTLPAAEPRDPKVLAAAWKEAPSIELVVELGWTFDHRRRTVDEEVAARRDLLVAAELLLLCDPADLTRPTRERPVDLASSETPWEELELEARLQAVRSASLTVADQRCLLMEEQTRGLRLLIGWAREQEVGDVVATRDREAAVTALVLLHLSRIHGRYDPVLAKAEVISDSTLAANDPEAQERRRLQAERNETIAVMRAMKVQYEAAVPAIGGWFTGLLSGGRLDRRTLGVLLQAIGIPEEDHENLLEGRSTLP